jgi:hypothetical protein
LNRGRDCGCKLRDLKRQGLEEETGGQEMPSSWKLGCHGLTGMVGNHDPFIRPGADSPGTNIITFVVPATVGTPSICCAGPTGHENENRMTPLELFETM